MPSASALWNVPSSVSRSARAIRPAGHEQLADRVAARRACRRDGGGRAGRPRRRTARPAAGRRAGRGGPRGPSGATPSASLAVATSIIPADGSSRTTSPTSSTRASPSSPVPAPTSTRRSVGASGIAVRTASATSAARAIRSGVSQSRARSSNVVIGAQSDQAKTTSGERSAARANATMSPASLPDPGLLLAWQLADLLLDQVDPAARDGVHAVVRQPGDRVDPGRIHPLDRPGRRPRPARRARAGRRGSRSGRRRRSSRGPPPRRSRARSGRGRRRGRGGRRTGSRSSSPPQSSTEIASRIDRSSPAIRSISALIRPEPSPLCCDGGTPSFQPARSSSQTIMSRSPGDRPACVRSAAASERCWVPWFTTCWSIRSNRTPSSSRASQASSSVASQASIAGHSACQRATSSAGVGSGSRSGLGVSPSSARPCRQRWYAPSWWTRMPPRPRSSITSTDDQVGSSMPGRTASSRRGRPALVGEEVADVVDRHGRRSGLSRGGPRRGGGPGSPSASPRSGTRPPRAPRPSRPRCPRRPR